MLQSAETSPKSAETILVLVALVKNTKTVVGKTSEIPETRFVCDRMFGFFCRSFFPKG
jgi:hypothetical protein